jgi:hypothetical protein
MQTIKAYILTIDKPISREYAQYCADSCDRAGINWEYFEGWCDIPGVLAWARSGINLTINEGKPITLPPDDYPFEPNPNLHAGEKAECCTVGHAAIWKKIAEGDEDVGIVLEHDALMLTEIDIDIPENRIVVLGYKLPHPERYDHVTAGPPVRFVDILGHEGAHAYAMTKKTAQFLIQEIETTGRLGCVDNAYFILNQRRTKVPLCIADPTPAIGWLRESTIWNGSAYRNYEFIDSFKQNYK